MVKFLGNSIYRHGQLKEGVNILHRTRCGSQHGEMEFCGDICSTEQLQSKRATPFPLLQK